MINLKNYMEYYKFRANLIMESELNKFSIIFINYQVEVQKECNKEIEIKDKRSLQDFIENSKNFYVIIFIIMLKYISLIFI